MPVGVYGSNEPPPMTTGNATPLKPPQPRESAQTRWNRLARQQDNQLRQMAGQTAPDRDWSGRRQPKEQAVTSINIPPKPNPARGWPEKVNGRRGKVAGLKTGGQRPGFGGALDRLFGFKSPGQRATEGRARAEQLHVHTESRGDARGYDGPCR